MIDPGSVTDRSGRGLFRERSGSSGRGRAKGLADGGGNLAARPGGHDWERAPVTQSGEDIVLGEVGEGNIGLRPGFPNSHW